jgi:hypothetical protein
MNKKLIVSKIALMAVFIAVPLTLFTENVRTVQILGLFTSGAVFGASLTAIVSAIRSKQTEA